MENSTIAKKFINNKEDCVTEALEGLCMLNPKLVKIDKTSIVTLRERSSL